MLATESFNAFHRVPSDTAQRRSARLPEIELADLFAEGTLKRIPARGHAFVEGDDRSNVYIVEAGAISSYRMLADGSRQVIDFALPGDIIGLGAQDVYETSAQATEPTTVRGLPYRVLHRLALENPSIAMKLYEATSRELSASRDLLVTVGQRSALQRVATFLLALAARNQRQDVRNETFRLPMTRADIGDFLGLTIETVSRSFTKLKGAGLIHLGQKNEVRIDDMDALNALCIED